MRKISKGNVTIKLWDIGGQPRWIYGVYFFVCLFDHSGGGADAGDGGNVKNTFVDIKGMLAMVMMMTIMMGVVLMNNELLRVSQELL